MADETNANNEGSIEQQATQQTGQQQVRLRVDERNMQTTYSNAFRTNGTAEEVMLDFGINTMTPAQQQGARARSFSRSATAS